MYVYVYCTYYFSFIRFVWQFQIDIMRIYCLLSDLAFDAMQDTKHKVSKQTYLSKKLTN